MRIGIDIDDTITNSCEVVEYYINKYDSDYSDNQHLIKNLGNILRGFLADEITQKFFLDHSKEMGMKIQIKENAKEVIDKLREEGNEVIIITARSNKFYQNAQEFCEEYLRVNNINYDKLVTGQTFKLDACINENIDLMIDDAVDTVEAINNYGIKTILFNSKLNKDKETSIKRVSNWLELYNEIHNL